MNILVIVNFLMFFGPPVGALVFFAVSLCRYLGMRRKDKKNPGCIPPELRRARRTPLIISSIVAGVLLSLTVGFMLLVANAIAHM